MIRACIRLAGACVVSAVMLLIALCGGAIGFVMAAWGRRIRAWAMHVWSRGLVRAVGLEMTVEGTLTPGAAVLAPNHIGYLDIITVGALTPGFFVSRADLASWPVLGALANAAGTLYVDRERHRDAHRVAGEARTVLHGRQSVIVFLEGRAGPGDDVQRFRSPLLEPAVDTGAPCVPIAIRYSLPDHPDADIAKIVSWHDGTPFTSHVWRLARHGRVAVHVTILPARRGDDRKVLAAALENDVRAVVRGGDDI